MAAAAWRASCSTIRSRLRVVHATDVHCLVSPSASQVLSQPKRLVGWSNLYLLRRAERFSLDVQRDLVQSIIAQQPDVCILSGDLTNLATRDEFQLAREVLQPLLENPHFPTFIVPGNHDAYTPDAVSDERGAPTSADDAGTRGVVAARLMREYFGPWMESLDIESELPDWQLAMATDRQQFRKLIQQQQSHFLKFNADDIPEALRTHHPSSSSAPSPLPFLPVFAFDFLRLVGLNPCRPTRIGSNGAYDLQQLRMLEHLLRASPQPEHSSSQLASPLMPFTSTYNLLVGHYPILDGRGHAYESKHTYHGVSNGLALRSILQHPANRLKPQMFVHGHVHRGFQDQLLLDDAQDPDSTIADTAAASSSESSSRLPPSPRQMLILNPGSSGQSFSAKARRCAAFNVYTLGRGARVPPEEPASFASTPLRTRRATPYPFPAFAPPFANAPRPSRDAVASSPFRTDRNTSNGARGGVQTVHQAAADGASEDYFTSIERHIHDGERFRPEEFPYTSGF